MSFFLPLVLLIIFNAGNNPDIAEVKVLYDEGRFREAIEKLDRITATQKTGDKILLYRGLLEEDAEKSIAFFKEIVVKYPQSGYCNYALYLISQYEFLQGSYKRALSTLKRIIISFPESKYYRPSCLWIASSYEALKDTTNAIKWYKRIEKSDTVTLSIAKEALSRLSRKKSIYSIQIGSFKNIESAKNLVASFSEKGYDTWLAITRKEGIKYYKVLIGEFKSKDAAFGFSKLFGEKEKISLWIVKIKKFNHREH